MKLSATLETSLTIKSAVPPLLLAVLLPPLQISVLPSFANLLLVIALPTPPSNAVFLKTPLVSFVLAILLLVFAILDRDLTRLQSAVQYKNAWMLLAVMTTTSAPLTTAQSTTLALGL
jgi:hypothetical protein